MATGPQRSRHRRWIAPIVALGVAAASLGSAGQGAAGSAAQTAELAIGEWRGHASAIGVTRASDQGGVIIIEGTFSSDLNVSVPNQGPTTGFWNLNGQTNWDLILPGVGQGTAFMSHSSQGEMAGDRSQISLGRSQIISSGTATLPDAGSFPVSSVDAFGPLDLKVVALFCDDVYGEWVLSWNTMLSGASFSPTFNGNWQARRLPADGELADLVETLMPEINDVSQRLITAWGDAEMVDGVPVLPIALLADLLSDAVAISNELNMLTTCDIEYFGADNVQQWIYSFTRAVSLVTEALTVAIEREGQSFAPAPPPPSLLPAADLVRWSALLAGAGAIGPGSLDPDAPTNWERLDGAIQLARSTATGADSITIEALADQLGAGADG